MLIKFRQFVKEDAYTVSRIVKENENDDWVHGHAEFNHPHGLHARSSTKLTKAAKSFTSDIHLAKHHEGPWHDAKSIVKVMNARIPPGHIHFRAKGVDAHDSIKHLTHLVKHEFEDK